VTARQLQLLNYTVIIHFTSKRKHLLLFTPSELYSVSLVLLHTEDYITEILNKYK